MNNPVIKRKLMLTEEQVLEYQELCSGMTGVRFIDVFLDIPKKLIYDWLDLYAENKELRENANQ